MNMSEKIDVQNIEGKGHETNYLTFFAMGIIFFVFGITYNVYSFLNGLPFVYGTPLFVMGPIFLGFGLANRGKWKKTGWL